MKLHFSRSEKIFLIIFLSFYFAFAIWNAGSVEFPEGVGHVWQENLPILGVVNPLTVIMTVSIIIALIAIGIKFKKSLSFIPSRFQSAIELLLSFLYNLVEDTIPVEELVKPVFYFVSTLFLFIVFSNVLGGIPGISVSPVNGGLSINFFNDTWYSPTADLNTNLTYALVVFIASYIFAIKHKGLKVWAKGLISPSPFMLPMNILGEISRPISHSFRLFGNIGGGALISLMLCYLTKYTVVPVVVWGFFGFFIGAIQAYVFTILAVAYINAQLE
ncbi:F0F1 ATP synthase subunit A [Athalassotoga saccharophila]|uniref:F0F1 ATP synthase subunit A n=1 Tax=Athalassotoga saccharophila TaxID=1441386 RepID=UPI00137A200F|nr:F0F1 ATP synthase subunit A [Athalassotoga saccharophila]BBJ27837.1 ATP synthase subunit a [Athalassotoga saccharophila]